LAEVCDAVIHDLTVLAVVPAWERSKEFRRLAAEAAGKPGAKFRIA
jgi:hypothetical protein